MTATVAIVGRPNVGKSTLMNRLLGRQDAVVQERPGVTRDRKEVQVEWQGETFRLIDTGGWMRSGDTLDDMVSSQASKAVEEADLVLFVVDVSTGITSEDQEAARWLRKLSENVMLIANKVDGIGQESLVWEFLSLGFGEPFMVSALHGRNAGDLLDEIIERTRDGELAKKSGELNDQSNANETTRDDDHLRVAIVGRPNVGKSTLFNRLVNEERSVVHDMPGTTRDSVDTVVETELGNIRFVDTAGMRRKAKIDEGAEYYSMIRAIRSIEDVDVVMMVIDAIIGITNQDQRLAERIERTGKPTVILLNKWEVLSAEQREQVVNSVELDLAFVSYAPLLKISAKTGKGCHKLLEAIDNASVSYSKRFSTAEVTKVVLAAQQAQAPKGSRIYFASQGATNPPTFTIFSSRKLSPSYLRFIERRLREHFQIGPSPIKIRVRRKSSN